MNETLNSYELSRQWFDFSFKNPEMISLYDILNYKIIDNRNYNHGGFYMIKNKSNNKIYIGKSINYMSRLKQHLYLSANKTEIDLALNNGSYLVEFYLLLKYSDLGINFFNRKLETIIENTFINIALSYLPEKGYNKAYYGHLQVI
ncbi:GIY-YIG nuclease family protein [Flavobacteriaceae bacterium]|nr:GIY-YIG nuclease family protein [Flavobacteriaceae bacterium]